MQSSGYRGRGNSIGTGTKNFGLNHHRTGTWTIIAKIRGRGGGTFSSQNERKRNICYQKLGLYTISKFADSIGIIKSILVLVSERQINDTFNDTLQDDINMHKAILTHKWTICNKIDVLCLFNYTILKIVCPELYIKRLIIKVNSLAAFYS